MPTYESRCKDCGEELEAVQAFTDDPLTVCPNCGGTLRKVFGSIGITFKGSGFYKTDSRSKSTASKTSDSSSDTKTSDTKSSDSTSSDSTSSTSDTKKDSSSTKSSSDAKSA